MKPKKTRYDVNVISSNSHGAFLRVMAQSLTRKQADKLYAKKHIDGINSIMRIPL